MTKRHSKHPVPPSKPITYRRLYTKNVRGERTGIIVGLFFFSVPCFMFFTLLKSDGMNDGTPFMGILTLFGGFFLSSAIFSTLQSIILDGEKLIFSYRFKNQVYLATDIQSIAWGTGIYMRGRGGITINLGSPPRFPGDLGPSGDIGGQYGRYVALFITLKNGKRAEIPGSPDARVDLKKILLEWQEKYNPIEI